MKTIGELKEELAAIEHERWADWQRYVHEKLPLHAGGQRVLERGYYEHWERQIATPYAQLSEREKDSDREQVERYWTLIEAYCQERERQARIDQTQKIAAGVKAITKSEQPTEVESYIAGELCRLQEEQ